ncbi:sensor histidine kinase [Tannockella kyphosi]|uniref:sensor histidine kinase n=1 Tax=Tannockella kyphosi TaxID=2899121 RepID=UPI002011F65C|nr:HAMP domain-containing sensor histidine kinase [Tannockella kyphosi]
MYYAVKTMSLKIKLSIYNALLMSMMVVIVIAFLIMISGNVVVSSSQNTLTEAVEEVADEVEYEKGKIEIDDDVYYSDQVSILIYSSQGVLLEGVNNHNIDESLSNGQIGTITIDGNEYMYYDVFVGDENLFVRGIVSTSAITGVLDEVFRIAIIMLPTFIAISFAGSYFLCKRSFKPLDNVIETAEKISKEDDLTLRIHPENKKDEITRLAITFDKMMEKLENMMKVEKQFTSDVSHELRTPVSIILAECEIAKNGTQEELNQSVQGIEKQTIKIKNLINQLLNLVRLENGIHKLELETVDLSELIELICNEQRKVLPSSITIEDDIQEGITYLLDYTMISRVIVNLINNSIKYIGQGSTIKVSLAQTQETIHITVADDGIGIPASGIENIFTRFYQVDKARNGDSMGLGLSMVKQLVELHGGQIGVTSELDKGSTFVITLKK